MVEGGGRLQESLALLHTEDGGEPVGGLCAQERERRPTRCEDMRREEAEAAVADAQGRGGQAVDVFPVQAIALQLLCGAAVGGCVVSTGLAGGLLGQRMLVSVRLCRCGGEPRSSVDAVGSCGISLRETRSGLAKEDIIDRSGKEERS